MDTDTAQTEYWTMPETGDRKFFRCVPRMANIQVATCSKMFEDAQTAAGVKAERLAKCRTCSLGAQHAGRTVTHFSRFYGLEVCPRCHRGGARMIGDALCVSCYNRQREVLVGKNAKGTKPVKLAPLCRRSVHYVVLGAGRPVVSEIVLPLSVDATELMISVLRRTAGRVAFAAIPRAPMVRQLRMAV